MLITSFSNPNCFLRRLGATGFTLFIAAFFIFYSGFCNAEAGKKVEAYKSFGVDVYGTNDKESARILRQYKTKLKQFMDASMPDSSNPDGMVNYPLAKKIHDEIKSELTAEGKFSFVNLSPVVYPDQKEIAFTIDLVENKDQLARNTFDPEPKMNIKDPNGLIENWIKYESTGWKLFYSNKIMMQVSECPDNHCTFGYDDPQLEPFKSKFKSVDKYEKQIVDVLRNDKDHKKRAAAAMLIGIMSNPQHIVEDLIPSLRDPEPVVRNNAMRVIGVVKMKHKDVKIKLEDFINALNGPTTIDRNKSLFVVLQLTNDKRAAELLNNKETRNILVNLLKLKQPNNHDMAYDILKKLSHKNYVETDIKSWSTWAQFFKLKVID